jgi:hypothetical protein
MVVAPLHRAIRGDALWFLFVIPAEAGGAFQQRSWSSRAFSRWIPAFAGMTGE